MKIYFLLPEDELPQDQFDRKALDIEALLRRLGVTRKLTGFQYVCYMVNQVVEDPSRLSLITKRLYPETARHFHTTRDSIELATRNVIRAVWGRMGSGGSPSIGSHRGNPSGKAAQQL